MSGTLPARDQVGEQIPGWLTSFVGRQDELSQLSQLLDGESRLVTLCGLGGAGKSRLAAELARGFVLRGEHVARVRLAVQQLLGAATFADPSSEVS